MKPGSVLSLVCLLAVGCAAGARPAGRAPGALYRDLERIVAFAETTGWEIDSIEVEEVLGDALLSVCRTDLETRQMVLAWVDQRITALGGPVEQAWLQRGKKLSRVEALLRLSRVRLLLVASMEEAEQACPFWMQASSGFSGRQISDDRWQLELAGGGKGFVTVRGDVRDVSGGGAGRLLLMRHVGASWGFGLGAEIGAGADFQKDESGERQSLIFAFDLVAPLVIKWRGVQSFMELEVGPLAHFTEEETELVPGLHLGFAVGGQALRQRWFLPGVAFAISYERTFPDDGDPLHMFKLGVRVAVDVDL